MDYEQVSAEIVLGENAAESSNEGTVVYLDASFVVAPEERGQDFIFPRLPQMVAMLAEQSRRYDEAHGVGAFERLASKSSSRMPGPDEEWRLLRKAWSLERNGKRKLSEIKVGESSSRLYASDPLSSIEDWMWRFGMTLSGLEYERKFGAAMKCVALASERHSERFDGFIDYFHSELYPERMNIYFSVFKEFFESYSEFGQIHAYCAIGMPLPSGYIATSQDFDRTKMFYGNAFEALMTLVETLACINNVLSGREHDNFERMTLDNYRKTDKAGRCNAFTLNVPFSSLCEEADNQIRNASHHGGFRFDPKDSLVRYRAGKGGLGEEKAMSYTEYLFRCTRIFLSIVALMRIDLVLWSQLQLVRCRAL